jgi:S-formylglutathione hydrolase FrmB
MKLPTASRMAAWMLFLLPVGGCRQSQPVRPDHPYIAPGAVMQDVTFHSAALNREMPYRVFLPALIKPGERPPVVYLLHGGNGGFRDWSNDSTVSVYAAEGLILVMPEGEFSYYMNAAENPSARFEDYTFHDLIADVESRFPAATTKDKRGIVGISMGGFAAIKIALTRPDLFGFVGAFSPPVDIAHRRFHPRSWGEWWRVRTIFGPSSSETRRARDPLTLVQSADPKETPYIYLTAGEREPLLDPDQRFAAQLETHHFDHEFHTQPGGHDWGEWNRQIPGCFESLFHHLHL